MRRGLFRLSVVMACAALVAGLVGCSDLPIVPTEADAIGTWRVDIDETSDSVLKEYGGSEGEVTFNPDGTLVSKDIPLVFVERKTAQFGETVAGEGQWILRSYDERLDEIEVVFADPQSGVRVGRVPGFSRRSGRLYMSFWISADAATRYVLVKSQ